MNFNEAMNAINSGKMVKRLGWGEDSDFYSGEDLDEQGLTREDFMATDWVVELERSLDITVVQIIAAWNSSLPPGSPEMNLAPNSARYKRFIEALRG